MKKLFILVILFFLLVKVHLMPPEVFASTSYPDFTVTKSDIFELSDFQTSWNGQSNETPLLVFTGDSSKDYLFPSGGTIKCNDSLVSALISNTNKGIDFRNKSCLRASVPELVKDNNWSFDGSTRGLRSPAEVDARGYDWIRTYFAIYGIHLNQGNAGRKLLFIDHGENSQYRCTDTFTNTTNYYQNTVNKFINMYPANDDTTWLCWVGQPTFPSIGWSWAGSEMISWSWADYDENKNWDLNDLHQGGPIAWPAVGFVRYNNGQWEKSSDGLRHPRSIINNGYVYVFYVDLSRPNAEEAAQGWSGWGSCTKAARAKLGNDGLPGPFKVYTSVTDDFTEDALPAGFTNENIRNFWNVKGPKGTCISTFSDTFSVAKIKGSNYFLALDSYSSSSPPAGFNVQCDHDCFNIALRISDDLIHWGPPHFIRVAPNWTSGLIEYSIFLDKNGTTNYEIDPDEFYVTGTNAYQGYHLTAMKISLSGDFLPPDPTRLLVMQYFKELLNWDIEYKDAGGYHADMINNSGCKADVLDFSKAQTYQDRKNNYSDTDFMRMLYRAILSRESDQGGLDWYIDQLRNQGKNRDWALNWMLDSDEAQTACTYRKLLNPPNTPTPIPPTDTPIPPSPTHIPPTSTPIPPSPTPTPIPGDITGKDGVPDGKVDIYDYNKLIGDFGKTGAPGFTPSDIDKNGIVDIFDYNILIGNFGK